MKLLICLVIIIGLFITINLWHYYPLKTETIKVYEQVQNKCLIECTRLGDVITCVLPEGKNLTIREIKHIETTIK